MTSPRLLLLAALLSQGLSSPILSVLQEAFLDHWNTELNGPPLTSGQVTSPAIGSSFSEWQQAYLDQWNMELNAADVDHSESGQTPTEDHSEEGMMEDDEEMDDDDDEDLDDDDDDEENMQDSGNQNEDMEDINEDATESAMRNGYY